jgi:hypothetical protein
VSTRRSGASGACSTPATGELMYQRDEAALFDKKMGFIKEDFRILEQSR